MPGPLKNPRETKVGSEGWDQNGPGYRVPSVLVEADGEYGQRVADSVLRGATVATGYRCVTYDLGILRADAALTLAGNALTVYFASGTGSFKLSNVANDPIPFTALAYPELSGLVFTNVFLTNAIQAGASLIVFVGTV